MFQHLINMTSKIKSLLKNTPQKFLIKKISGRILYLNKVNSYEIRFDKIKGFTFQLILDLNCIKKSI